MNCLGILCIEAVSSEFKLQQGFRVFIENFFRVRLMRRWGTPDLAFSLSNWWQEERLSKYFLGSTLAQLLLP